MIRFKVLFFFLISSSVQNTMISANMLSNLSALIQKVGLGKLDFVLVEEVKVLLIEGTHQDLFHSVVQMEGSAFLALQ